MTARLLLLALVLLLASVLALTLQQLRLQAVKADLDTAQAAHHRAETLSADRLAAINALLAQARINAQTQADLRTREAAIRATLHSRVLTIRRLQRDNEKMRQWADALLPDVVVRLREHPEYIGADAYRQRLPQPDAVPAAGDGPTEERRPVAGSGGR